MQSSMAKKPVTITQIAKQAGVTAQTVSYVLTNNPNVKISDGTRERVRSIALELGYKPNRLAQAMKSGETRILGLCVADDGGPNLTAFSMIREFVNQARAHGYEVLSTFISSHETSIKEIQWPIDGLLLVGPSNLQDQLRTAVDGLTSASQIEFVSLDAKPDEATAQFNKFWK